MLDLIKVYEEKMNGGNEFNMEKIFRIDDTEGIRIYSFDKNFIEEEVINQVGKVRRIIIGNVTGEAYKTVFICGQDKTLAILPNTMDLGDPLLDIVYLENLPEISFPCINLESDYIVSSIYASSYNVCISLENTSLNDYISIDCDLQQINTDDEDDWSERNLIFVPMIVKGC